MYEVWMVNQGEQNDTLRSTYRELAPAQAVVELLKQNGIYAYIIHRKIGK